MQLLWNKTWVGCVLLLCLHQIIQKVLTFELGLIDNYLDPFLSMPIILGLILQERQYLIPIIFNTNKPTNYHFSILEISIATAFFAIIFEEFFPKWSTHFTRDYWDYIAYFSGAFIFYLFINKRVSTNS